MTPVNPIHVLPAAEPQFETIASLHRTRIHRGFLSSLGDGFLTVLYRGIARSKHATVLCAVVGEGKVAGFVAGTVDTRLLYRDVLSRNAWRLSWAALPAVARPSTWCRFGNTLRYGFRGGKEPVLPRAELLAIATDSAYRGAGLGGRLMDALEEWYRERSVTEYRLVTYSEDSVSNSFYQKHAYQLGRTFEHHGRVMQEYRKRLEPQKP